MTPATLSLDSASLVEAWWTAPQTWVLRGDDGMGESNCTRHQAQVTPTNRKFPAAHAAFDMLKDAAFISSPIASFVCREAQRPWRQLSQPAAPNTGERTSLISLRMPRKRAVNASALFFNKSYPVAPDSGEELRTRRRPQCYAPFCAALRRSLYVVSALAKPSAAHAASETSPGVHDGQNLHASGEDGIASVAHGDCLALTTPELQTQVIPLCRLLVSCMLDHDRACLHDAAENRSRRRCGPIVSPRRACAM